MADRSPIAVLRERILKLDSAGLSGIESEVHSLLFTPFLRGKGLSASSWEAISEMGDEETFPVAETDSFLGANRQLSYSDVAWQVVKFLDSVRAQDARTALDNLNASKSIVGAVVTLQAWLYRKVDQEAAFEALAKQANSQELTLRELVTEQEVRFDSKLEAMRLSQATKALAVTFNRDFARHAKNYAIAATMSAVVLAALVGAGICYLFCVHQDMVAGGAYRALDYYQFVLLFANNVSLMLLGGVLISIVGAAFFRFLSASMNFTHRASVADAMVSVSEKVEDHEVRRHLLTRGGDQVFVPPTDQGPREAEAGAQAAQLLDKLKEFLPKDSASKP